jgi:hypothetical protein
MKTVKPLAALLLLGAVSLTACGKPDTVQESELQPAEPRQAEREQILAELPNQEPEDPERPICRNLKPGDPWYPRWTYCCDTADKTQSYWTGAEGYPSGTWSGNCYSFGLR